MTSIFRSTNYRRRGPLLNRRLTFERCEARQLLATDLAWAIPQLNVNDVEVDATGNVVAATDHSVGKISPSGTPLWGKSTPFAYSLSIAGNGDICVVGYFSDTFAFGPGNQNQITSAGLSDIFIAKFDSTGQFLWARSIGGTGYESAYGVDFDPAGNVVVTGEFNGTLDFDPGAANHSLTAVSGNSDTFVAKFDSSGNYLWADAIAGISGPDFGDYLTCDSQGNVIVVGRFYLQADFDPGPGTTYRTTSGSADGFVLKLNPNGGFVWVNQLSATVSLSGAFGVVTDENDNVYATGEFRGFADFDPSSAVFSLYSTTGFADVFLWKMNSSGSLIWAKNYSSTPTGPSDSDYGMDLARDDAGNLYVTGYFGNTRGFIGQFDSTGNPLRIREMTGATNYGNAIDVDSSGNVFVGGFSQGAINYPGASNPISSAAGFLLRLNPFDPNASITGRAWQDLDGDGVQDSGEPSLANVPAQLVRSTNTTFGDSDDVIVGSTNTAADGTYHFDHLDWVYNYFVAATAPAGFSSGGAAGVLSIAPIDQGGDDQFDNDLDPANGRTAIFSLEPGQTAKADFGFRGNLPNFGWATRTTNNGSEEGKYITRDSAGNFYVLAVIQPSGTIDFDPGAAVTNSYIRGSTEVVLIKYSQAGAFQWMREFATTSADVPAGLAVDSSGNVYFAGYFPGSLSFGYGTSIATIDNGFNPAVGIFKIDINGSLIWSRYIRLPFGGSITARALAVNDQNELLLTGEFSGALLIDGLPALNSTSTSKDAYITKLSTTGSFLWARLIDTSSQISITGIDTDLSGNIYTTGTFTGTVDFDPSAAVNSLTAVSNSTFIAKLTSAGDYVWASQIAGATTRQLTVTNTAVLLTGAFSGTVDFDPSADGQADLTSTNTTAFVAKLDLDSNFQWARSVELAASAFASGAAVATDPWENIYVVGDLTNTADFDPSAATFNLAGNPKADIFIWKLDRFGNLVTAASFGGLTTDAGEGITVDSDGNIFYTGLAFGVFDFDPTAGTFSPGVLANADLFLAAWYNPAPPPAGDFNGDGNTDAADFTTWQTNFPKTTAATILDGDADGDGDVDGADFIAWQVNLPVASGSGSSTEGSAPEERVAVESVAQISAANDSASCANDAVPAPIIAAHPVEADSGDAENGETNSDEQNSAAAIPPELKATETELANDDSQSSPAIIVAGIASPHSLITPMATFQRTATTPTILDNHSAIFPALSASTYFAPHKSVSSINAPPTSPSRHQPLVPAVVDQLFAQSAIHRGLTVGHSAKSTTELAFVDVDWEFRKLDATTDSSYVRVTNPKSVFQAT